MKRLAGMLAFVFMLFTLTSCAGTIQEDGLWDAASYTEDTEFGAGEKTVKVKVQAEEKTVIFTIHTDKENLADALLEHNLISGEQGPYGLYIKSVNGIVADYNINQSYWSLCKSGEVMQTGASEVYVSDGEEYEMVYTK